ncbi:MAG: SipW-dependent-type signal peptide-containing protein, partial [Clostridiaceae bacterium]
MKRKLMLLALLMSLCSILTIGTLAYFTSVARAHNIITTGNIAIELQELTNELDETGQPVAFENVHG